MKVTAAVAVEATGACGAERTGNEREAGPSLVAGRSVGACDHATVG